MSSFKKVFIAILVALIIGGIVWGAWQKISASSLSPSVDATLGSGLSRFEITETIGAFLKWSEEEKNAFASTYAQMQWARWNSVIDPIFRETFDWDESAREIFLTHSTFYIDPQYDFLSSAYEPGVYTIDSKNSVAEIAGLLIERTEKKAGSNLRTHLAQKLEETEMNAVAKFVQKELELLPDLVPFPALDVRIDRVGENVLLSFTTVYYNRGRGPLELRADPKTSGIRADVERNVFQRIYLRDGGYRDREAGTFLWHQPHLHYHFADFVVYDLEVVEAPAPHPDLSGVRSKSTFCIRDISRVILDVPDQEPDAVYKICKKELQGISVGWGDSYFYNYPDQNLNITDLPSGTYKLSFIVNPEDRFDEITKDNNVSSVVLKIDMEKPSVEVLESSPKEMPKLEHVYPKQDCSNCTL